jgi:PAS domain S-box-containing protein
MEIVAKKKFEAKVLKTENLAQGVKKITFKISEEFNFLPAQYVWVEILEMKVDDPHGARRAFSIVNLKNEENTIEIVARISESGYKQSLFALKKDDEVNIHGPFGHSFTLSEKHKPENIIMIAGGVGIAAFMPTLLSVQKNLFSSKCELLYINKNKIVTPFLKDLAQLKKARDFFNYKVKFEYFVWEDISDMVSKISGTVEWWIAGPQGFVDSVYQILEEHGVSRDDMVFENYYPKKKGTLTKEIVDKTITKDNLFAKAIQNSTNHTIITDAEGVVLFANKAAQNITGFSEQEILGNTPRLWGGLMSGEFYKNFWKKKIKGEVFQGEIVNRRKNGEMYYSIAHIAPIFGENRDVVGFIATEEDITERVKLERSIEESKAFLNSIVENLPSMVFVKSSKDLKFVLFNKASENLTGFKANEVLGKTDYDFFPKDQAKSFVQNDKSVLFKKELIDIPEEFIQTKDKGEKILHTKKIPILNSNGEAVYILGISEDITEDKEHQREIEQMNAVMVNRELKMIELKKKIKELEEKINEISTSH